MSDFDRSTGEESMEIVARACEPIICPGTLAQRLQTLRLKAGWKLEEVADRAGVARSTLYHLERGTTPHPRAATVYRLAEAYGVAVELLINSSESASSETAGRQPATRGRLPAAAAATQWQRPERVEVHPGDSLSKACRFDRATNPAVEAVAASDPQLFSGWSTGDWEELYSTFATGGALNEEGVRQLASQINRQRETVQRLRIVLHTHLADVATGMVDTLFRLVCPEAGAEELDEVPGACNNVAQAPSLEHFTPSREDRAAPSARHF